jgi:hypothetical protein
VRRLGLGGLTFDHAGFIRESNSSWAVFEPVAGAHRNVFFVPANLFVLEQKKLF